MRKEEQDGWEERGEKRSPRTKNTYIHAYSQLCSPTPSALSPRRHYHYRLLIRRFFLFKSQYRAEELVCNKTVGSRSFLALGYFVSYNRVSRVRISRTRQLGSAPSHSTYATLSFSLDVLRMICKVPLRSLFLACSAFPLCPIMPHSLGFSPFSSPPFFSPHPSIKRSVC